MGHVNTPRRPEVTWSTLKALCINGIAYITSHSPHLAQYMTACSLKYIIYAYVLCPSSMWPKAHHTIIHFHEHIGHSAWLVCHVCGTNSLAVPWRYRGHSFCPAIMTMEIYRGPTLRSAAKNSHLLINPTTLLIKKQPRSLFANPPTRSSCCIIKGSRYLAP